MQTSSYRTGAMPASYLVAIALGSLFAALAALPVPPGLYRAGARGLGAVLALRAIGDFRYVGAFMRVRRCAFAGRDTASYTPLCAALAAGVFDLAAA